MFALSSTTEYPAMAAGQQCTAHAQRTHSCSTCQFAQAMCGMWAAASILLIQTGVSASVSLFVLLIILVNLLCISLVSLSELVSLSGLTGLVVSLVGHLKGLSPGTSAGD
jgi:hypothetical protein